MKKMILFITLIISCNLQLAYADKYCQIKQSITNKTGKTVEINTHEKVSVNRRLKPRETMILAYKTKVSDGFHCPAQSFASNLEYDLYDGFSLEAMSEELVNSISNMNSDSDSWPNVTIDLFKFFMITEKLTGDVCGEIAEHTRFVD